MSMTMQGQAERGFGQSLAYGWARLYTKGMTEGRREHRLQQIESDLFEHTTDRTEGGASPSLVGFETLERFLRGIPADVLWRFQMEGINMRINIPFERIVGGSLLVMVVFIFIATSMSGYDTGADTWEDELTTLASRPGYEATFSLIVQMVAGIGLIGLGAALYVALRQRAPALTTFCAFGLAAAGVLTLVSSGLYGVVARLADDFATEGGNAEILVTSRAFAVALEYLMQAAGVVFLCVVYVLAGVAARERLAPRALAWLPILSGGLILVSWLIAAVGSTDWRWLVFMVGILMALLWLIVAGGWMLLGGAPNARQHDSEGRATGTA